MVATASLWRTLTGRAVDDVVAFVRENAREGQLVHVGSDSLQLARHTRFVTVVAILTPGRGGRALWRRETRRRIVSLRERLLYEVWLSVELALRLSPVVPGELSVHIDANPVARHRSSAYVQELVGLVVSQGFRAVIKPESWAASRAADRLVRVAPLLSCDEADRTPGPAVRSPQLLMGGAHSVNGI